MVEDQIEVVINGFKEKVPVGSTVGDLIRRLHESDPHLVVEHNGRLVTSANWDKKVVHAGDKLEFIHPCFGG